MKNLIIAFFILISFNLFSATFDTMDERGLWERMLVKIKIKEDTAKSFSYSKLTAYTRKNSSRRVRARVKNNSSDDFKWVTFKVMVGERDDALTNVYRFTVNDFKGKKTYYFDEVIPLHNVKGKKIEVVYIDSKKYK